MIKCREVTELIATDALQEAGWMMKLIVRTHLLMCRYCREYLFQIRAIGLVARSLLSGLAGEDRRIEPLERKIFGAEMPDGS